MNHRLLVVLAWLAASNAAAQADPVWQWEHPRPQGATIAALHAEGATTHAVGARGTILASRDDGKTWSLVPSPVANNLHAVSGSPGLVVAVGDNVVIRSSHGAAFETRSVPISGPLVDVSVTAATVYVLAHDGSLLRSFDGGTSFVALNGASSGTSIAATSVASGPAGVFVATTTGLYRSTDAGATFVRIAAISEPIGGVVADNRTIYAIGGTRITYHSLMVCNSCMDDSYETRSLYRSSDGGATWQQRVLEDPVSGATGWDAPRPPAPPARPPARSIGGVGPGGRSGPIVSAPWRSGSIAIGPNHELYVSGASLLVSTDGGATLATRALDLGGAIRATAAGTLIVAGGAGRMSRSTDRGATWRSLSSATADGKNLFSIAVTPSGRAFAAGMDGLLLARDRATSTWTKLVTPASEQRLSDVVAVDDDHVIVVGDAGLILQSRDGGRTFTKRASGTSEHIHTVWGIGNEIYAAGGDGTVVRSVDHGATWKPLARLKQDAGIDLWGSSLDDIYLVTINGQQLHSTDRGKTWIDVGGSLDGVIVGVWGTGPNDVFLVGWGGRLYHTADHGKTWDRRTTGTTEDLIAMWGRGPDDLYVIGGDANGYRALVLRSVDRGKTWREERVPLESGVLAIGGGAGAVYVAGTDAVLRRSP